MTDKHPVCTQCSGKGIYQRFRYTGAYQQFSWCPIDQKFNCNHAGDCGAEDNFFYEGVSSETPRYYCVDCDQMVKIKYEK